MNNKPDNNDLRDYFAAKAMLGYVMDESFHKDSDTSKEWITSIAEASYKLADAMLKVREGK